MDYLEACSLISFIFFLRLVFILLADLWNHGGQYVQTKGELLFLGLFLLGQSFDDLLLFGLEALFTALSCFLGLRPAGLSLVSQELLAGLVCLQLVDVFHENPLVFEHIPLHLQVQAVIHVAINFLRFPVSSEQPAQNPHSPHPCDLPWPSGIGCTFTLTYAHVPALPVGQGVFPAVSPRMDHHRLVDDQPIFHQLPDLLTAVSIGYFISGPTRPCSCHSGRH